jgi:hypothetical protein
MRKVSRIIFPQNIGGSNRPQPRALRAERWVCPRSCPSSPGEPLVSSSVCTRHRGQRFGASGRAR